MKTSRFVPALCAGFFVSALSVNAEEQSLSVPAASAYADTENSALVLLSNWEDLGRKFTLSLGLNASPSNAIQVAFGRDRNGDEDLEPEETEAVVGCDCGVWFARNDRGTGASFFVTPWLLATENAAATNDAMRTIQMRQPLPRSERWTLAKVTRRGKGKVIATLTADYHPGLVITVQ